METLQTSHTTHTLQTTRKKTRKKTGSPTRSLKFSIRISTNEGSLVTSISLKKNICSLWLLLRENPNQKSQNLKNMVLDFIHTSLDEWQKNNITAKGFSDFITERMIKDILTEKDFIEYKRIHDVI